MLLFVTLTTSEGQNCRFSGNSGHIMKILQELCHVISKYTSQKDAVRKALIPDDGRRKRLYEGVASGIYKSDGEAAQDIYNKTLEQSNYRNLKYSLINRLLDVFYLLHMKKENRGQFVSVYYKTAKELFAAEICEWLHLYSTLVLLCDRIEESAQKYDFTRLKLRCFELLRNYYSKHGSVSDYDKYAALAHEALLVYTAEAKSERVRTELVKLLSVHLTPSAKDVRQIAAKIPELQQDLKQYGTRTLYVNYYNVTGKIARLTGRFAEARKIYQSYLHYLDEHKHFDYEAQRIVVLHFISKCCFASGDYQGVLKHTDAALELLESKPPNWFAVVEVRLMALIHLQQYQEAADLFVIGIHQPEFESNELRREVWSILEAYLRLLSETCLNPAETIRGTKFSLSYTLEELSETMKDKLGMYIAILIFQIIHWLRQRSLSLVESRIRTLRDLLYKHARSTKFEGQFFRTDCLVKMLTIMVNCQYDSSLTTTKSKPYCEQLEAAHANDTTTDEGVTLPIEEIAPYSHIWNCVLQELRTIEVEMKTADSW